MAVVRSEDFFVSGGTLPPDSESYIERAADRALLNELSAGVYCYVLNARQMGKSSLSVRTMTTLEQRGIRTVFIDLTQVGSRNVTPSQWYAGMLDEIGAALDLTADLFAYQRANPEFGPMRRFFGALDSVVLTRIEGPVVVFIDEIDATRNLPFDTDEFFAGIRECFNRRGRNDAFCRLTFCLIGVAVPNDLIRNPVTTPFNIGQRIRVEDFSRSEVLSFGPALGANGAELASRVHYWTNGQPLITQSLCQAIVAEHVQSPEGVDALVEQLFFDPSALTGNANLADVANRLLNDPEHEGDPDKHRADLLSTYDRALRGAVIPYEDSNRISVNLRLSGLMRAEGTRLIPRNRIYRQVFSRTWIQANMPGQELLRQRNSFRRGLIRGIGMSAGVCFVVGAMALLAVRAQSLATAAENKALVAQNRLDRELYVSDMNRMRVLEETGNSAKMSAVLARWRSSSHRGFEWYFWQGRLHDAEEEYTLDYDAPGKRESALISADGRDICVMDSLAQTAVVCERKSGQVRAVAPLGRYEFIVATDAGLRRFSAGAIRMLAEASAPTPVSDELTGRVLFRIGTPGFNLGWPAWRPHSNFVLLNEKVRPDGPGRFVNVVDLRTGKSIFRMKGAPVEGETLSRDGRRFLLDLHPSENSETDQFSIWDTRQNREIDRVPSPPNKNVWLSDSGRLLAYQSFGGDLVVRNIDLRRDIVHIPHAIEERPAHIEIAPDDGSVANAAPNEMATVWALPTGREIRRIYNACSLAPADLGHRWIAGAETVRLIDVSPGGENVLTQGFAAARDRHGAIRVTPEAGGPIKRYRDSDLKRLSDISPPLGTSQYTYTRLWGAQAAGKQTRIVSVDGTQPAVTVDYPVYNLACGDDRHLFVAMDPLRVFHALSVPTKSELWAKKPDPSWRGLWMTPLEDHLIASTEDGYLELVDPVRGSIQRRAPANRIEVTSLGFSPNGQHFLTGGGDGSAILWDTNTLKRLAEFRGNGLQPFSAVDISSDGQRVVTTDPEGWWHIWDATSGEQLTELRGSALPIGSAVFTSDGRSLITAGQDGLVRVWSGRETNPTVRLKLPQSAQNRLLRGP